MRTIQFEILDDADDEAAQASLRDMERINRWFGGERIALRLIGRVAPRDGPFRVLDVGAGAGGSARAICRAFPAASVVCLDHRLRNLRRAPQPRLAADAFCPPFPDGSFDIVFCSLFLHHFDDEDVVRLLGVMRRLARRALIVVDLERHTIARHFLRATRWALGWHEITVHDGAASVQSAFKRGELDRLARQAGLGDAVVRLHPPWFRVSLFAGTGY